MKITVKEDIAAPIDHVWAQATDVAAFERQALRRGVRLRRLDGGTGSGEGLGEGLAEGAGWRAGFAWRGRERELTLRVEAVEPPSRLAARIESGGFQGQSTAEALALSRGATRLVLTVEVKARTLASRLLLQSMRLGRAGIERRARERVAAWAREVEARWQRGGGRA